MQETAILYDCSFTIKDTSQEQPNEETQGEVVTEGVSILLELGPSMVAHGSLLALQRGSSLQNYQEAVLWGFYGGFIT